ncbi:MAG TPA: hypothetical protein VFG07_06070 [Thermoplasmata archaeon]|nr:hypothetical protein [Thermoplasmata archaeon]
MALNPYRGPGAIYALGRMNTMSHERTRGWVAAATVTVLMMVAVPGVSQLANASPVVEANPVSAAGATQSWAYGAYHSANVSGVVHNGSMGHTYGYILRAYFGVQVILNETNLSSTVRTIEVQRTMALNLFGEYCIPTCAVAVFTNNISVKALEVGTGFVNLTTAGQVYENGSAVPAVGLLNTFTEIRADFNETDMAWARSVLGTQTNSRTIQVNAAASAAVLFHPALGLYPTTLTPGVAWNSTSSFNASGVDSASYQWSVVNWTGLTQQGGNSSSGHVNASGVVTLSGRDYGTLDLNDGSVTHQLGIHADGPFSVREGLLFLPDNADLFGPSSDSMGVPSETAESAATSYLDVGAGGFAHLGLLSSASTFTSTADGIAPSSTVTPAAQPALVTPAAETTGPVTVQAQPETLTSAQQMTGCLQAGNCPIPSNVPPFKATGLVLVGLVVGLVVASALVVARRRQVPAPPRPQARLYPAGAGLSRPAGPGLSASSRTPPPPPEEDDPLGHLW